MSIDKFEQRRRQKEYYEQERNRPTHCVTDPPIISFQPAQMDACAFYRMLIPHLSIPNSTLDNNDGFMGFKEIAAADVAVIQRLVEDKNLRAIKQMHSQGIKVIYDIDDNLWDTPSYNPAHSFFTQIKGGFEVCARECNIFTVSTQPLKRAVESNTKNLFGLEIVVIPNAIDFRLFRQVEKQDDKVTVAWTGSNTHSNDIRQVMNIISELLEKNPKMHFAMIGLPLPNELVNHPRCKQLPYVPIAEFTARFSSWAFDILLAPLEDNNFNRSKSNIKMLEGAAIGAPVLVSPVRPYLDFVQYDKELEYLVCKKTSEWMNRITDLVNDKGSRYHLAQRMRRVTEKYYSIDVVKDKWIEVAKSLMK